MYGLILIKSLKMTDFTKLQIPIDENVINVTKKVSLAQHLHLPHIYVYVYVWRCEVSKCRMVSNIAVIY